MQKYCILAVEISSQLHGVALRIPHAYLCHLLSTSCKRILLVVCFASDPVQMPALRLDHTSCIEKKKQFISTQEINNKNIFLKKNAHILCSQAEASSGHKLHRFQNLPAQEICLVCLISKTYCSGPKLALPRLSGRTV
jgi:hypothetical protein